MASSALWDSEKWTSSGIGVSTLWFRHILYTADVALATGTTSTVWADWGGESAVFPESFHNTSSSENFLVMNFLSPLKGPCYLVGYFELEIGNNTNIFRSMFSLPITQPLFLSLGWCKFSLDKWLEFCLQVEDVLNLIFTGSWTALSVFFNHILHTPVSNGGKPCGEVEHFLECK